MPKTLIIAEKPSVAADLARVLGKLPEIGKLEKKKDYYENDQLIISSAIGHLVELKLPQGPNGKRLPWGLKHLPIIPNRFELQPIEKTLPRFKLLRRLLRSKDVDTVVNACDAGREGELIFRYLMDMADIKNKNLTVKRMWMQSMTDDAIIDAWRHLRSDEEMQPLAEAAVCRSESDWLIGLNGTRALTAFNSRHGGFNVTTAGRVQTPTLCILAERELEIRNFVPRPYWEVYGDFQVEKGQYRGRWFREQFEKDPDDPHKKPERIWDEAEAEAVRQRCLGKTGVVTEEKKPTKQAPPLLFDLTSLQRDAGGRYGFSARRTLQLAQACYERYKVLTYPRTDSKYLPDDYLATVRKTIEALAQPKPPVVDEDLASHARWLLENDRIKLTRRVFNTAKVTDHFAIIPTGKLPPPKMDEAAAKLYTLVLRRFLAIFYPSAEFEVTRRITRIGDDAFRTDGRVLVKPGYLAVYGRKAGVANNQDELVPITNGEPASVVDIEVKADETKPPPRFTDATLLSAMETAGKRVDDDDLREAMSERGLGTPATRASIIENLIRQKYVFRDDRNKRDLVVSNKGLALVDLLHELDLTTLGSPEMTGEWEYKLKQMEHGQLHRDEFMNEIRELTKSIVQQTKERAEEFANRPFPDIQAPCPECGAAVLKQTDGLVECYNPECKFRIKKHIASHELTEREIIELVTKGRVGPIETFKNRFGQPFTAELKLEKKKRSWKLEFIFEGDEQREEELKNLSDDQVICQIPLDGDTGRMIKVYETERAYVAPELAKDVDERGVRISKSILQKEIPREQAIKLFVDGKTDLIPGFISKKNRPFSARLTLDYKTGKLGFEFEPRKKATKKKAGESDQDQADTTVKKSAKKKTTKKKATRKKAASKKKTTKATKKQTASKDAQQS